MPTDVLDESPNEKISIRPYSLYWVELLLFLIYGFLVVNLCYFHSFNGIIVPVLLLLIFSNLTFVYSSRKATLNYEETQSRSDIVKVKNSTSRLIFICTGICLCLLSIAIISNFIMLFNNLRLSSIGPSLNRFFEIKTYLSLALITILPLLQIYYMVQTSHIFSFVFKD